jgi:hypothetical protein
MTAPAPEEKAQALYMRQRAAELHLWGHQHTATVPPWSELSPAEQVDWCAIAAREREAR